MFVKYFPVVASRAGTAGDGLVILIDGHTQLALAGRHSGWNQCGSFAAIIWLHAGQSVVAQLVPLIAAWIQRHLFQLVLGLIPFSLRNCIPEFADWLTAAPMQDMRLGLVDRLPKVCRRRETIAAALPSLSVVVI